MNLACDTGIKIEKSSDSSFIEVVSWLRDTPPFTSYRVNLLKYTTKDVIDILESHLKLQSEKLKRCPPKVYEILPEAVVVEAWSEKDEFKERPSVIVDAACGAAVLRGSHVFAPGVMAIPPNIPLNTEVNIFADVSGKCKRGLKIQYEDDYKLFVGVGLLKQNRKYIFGDEKPRGIAIETISTPSKIPIIDNDILPQDMCLLQNLPSIVCSKVLSPQKGEIILDMCAAPGNKTSHIAELMENCGIIIALDRSASKIDSIRSRCDLENITCVYAFGFDSTKAVDDNLDTKSGERVKEGPPFSPESFDKILLDAPCSALGQRPLMKNNMSDKAHNSYATLQRKLFHSALKLLKVGGTLVYSTCTIMEAECEEMIVWALKKFPCIELIPAEPLLGGPTRNVLGLSDEQRFQMQRFGPNSVPGKSDSVYNNSIGFFIAHLKKIDSLV